MNPSPESHLLTDLLFQLVSIDSTNPDLVPGGAGEGEISRFVQQWFEGHGIQAVRQEIQPGRFNVLATVKGSGGGKTLLLNAHMDVVGTSGMTDPFVPHIEGGRMYGRGTYDMKGGLAACMVALLHARDLGLSGDVVLTAVADEEYASIGLEALLEDLHADAAIVTEPSGLELCVAHKGFSWHQVTTHGKAAHGSRPDLGKDAILHMGHVLLGLETYAKTLQTRAPHSLLGHGSVHASLISGGQELSSYPERCELHIERRTLPGETLQDVEQEMRAFLQQVCNQNPEVTLDFSSGLFRDAFEVPSNHPFVDLLREKAAAVLGEVPKTTGMTFWMESALLQSKGIPTVVFGPSGSGAHALEEWVDLKSVQLCCEVLTETIWGFCQ